VNTGYELIRYRPEHKAMLAVLQKELLSSDAELNTRYLEWKYERTADGSDSSIYLACHEGRPVAMRGFHEATLEAGTPTQVFRVVIAGDALVSAPHRNRGLVSRIIHLAEKELASRHPYLVSLGGANRVNMLGLLTLGWRSAGAVQPAGRVTTRARAGHWLSSELSGMRVLWRVNWPRLLAAVDQRRLFRRLDAARAGRAGPGKAMPITVDGRPRVDAMAGLVERLGHDGRIRYRRDREYLDWRFRDPSKEYRFLYWDESQLEGYLVLSKRVTDLGRWQRVYVSDLEATHTSIRTALLSAAMSWGRFPELVTWTASLSDEEIRVLRDQGFAPVDPADTVRGCPCILVRPLGTDARSSEWLLGGRKITDISNWDVRVLYSMRG
jgi:hypothetical protein